MTGRAPARYGIRTYGYGLRPEEVTIGELAKKAGYMTAHLGKWHLGPVKKDNPVNPHAQGFDHYIAHDNFYDIGQNVSDNGEDPTPFEGETSDHLASITLDFIKEHVPTPRAVPLCGNSIGTDRRFLDAHLPDIENHLHYRSVDVSTIKELARRWAPQIAKSVPQKVTSHRALDDIRESIVELRHYRDHLFRLPSSPPANAEAD